MKYFSRLGEVVIGKKTITKRKLKMFANNRITNAIAKMTKQLSNLDKDTVQRLHKDFIMSSSEHSKCQELKSLKFQQGAITLDEANTMFALLGGVPSVFNKQSLAAKITLTKVFAEMIGK